MTRRPSFPRMAMLGPMRTHQFVFRAIACLLTAGTVRGAAQTSPPASTCRSTPPTTATPLVWDRIEELAGRYVLTLVNTGGEYGDSVERGALELWVNDSTRRFAGLRPRLGRLPGERPLAGAFESQSRRESDYRDNRASHDREGPGVELVGPALLGGGPVLFMGSPDATDASGERLRVRAVSPDGFWGTWSSELGFAVVIDSSKRVLANPGGHFCARRVRRE